MTKNFLDEIRLGMPKYTSEERRFKLAPSLYAGELHHRHEDKEGNKLDILLGVCGWGEPKFEVHRAKDGAVTRLHSLSEAVSFLDQ